MNTNPTLADRLAAVLARIGPGATYEFEAGADGREILRVKIDDLGNQKAVAGATKADAVAALEASFPAKG